MRNLKNGAEAIEVIKLFVNRYCPFKIGCVVQSGDI